MADSDGALRLSEDQAQKLQQGIEAISSVLSSSERVDTSIIRPAANQSDGVGEAGFLITVVILAIPAS